MRHRDDVVSKPAYRAIQTIDGTADIRVSAEYETGRPFPKIITTRRPVWAA